jgi:acyl carrier protein
VLRAHLARVLPDYMVPGFVQEVPALPLTTSGKLDRRALPGLPPGTGPEAATPPAAGAPAAPNGDSIAARVGEICREVLQRNDIGPDDDLFDLGAHSLTLTRISSRIRTRLGADIPLLVLYDDPTVAAIAAAVAGGTAR